MGRGVEKRFFKILHMDFPADKHSEEFEMIAKYKEEKAEEKIQKKDFNFEGAKLIELNLSEIDIHENVILNDSNIKNLSFGDRYILGNVKADNSTIENVSFNDVTVSGDLSFDGAKIKEMKIEATINSTIKGEVLLDGEVDVGFI